MKSRNVSTRTEGRNAIRGGVKGGADNHVSYQIHVMGMILFLKCGFIDMFGTRL